MFTDMVGYTALGQRNESLSLALVKEQRRVIRPVLTRHNGREITTIGDAFLVEFPNALDAVRCAYDIQRATREFNISLREDKRIHLRVGVHLGDVEESDGDIEGDAVNVASRIEPLAEDGGVCLTRQVYDHVQNKFELPLVSLGFKSLKNVQTPIEVYRMKMPWEGTGGTETALDGRRVAILPFSNISQEPSDEFFADGLTEELISTTSKIGELSLISRTSVMQYKEKFKPITEIGRELKAGTILEGSVRKAGNRVRVTIQMIDAARDQHLWAESYDRDVQDIFAIQSDIAVRVADALRVKLLEDTRKRLAVGPTSSPKAHEQYLKGRYFVSQYSDQNFRKAIECYEAAIQEDPHYALAHVGLAECYTYAAGDFISKQVAVPLAKQSAAEAVRLDPGLAEAHEALAILEMQFGWDWATVEREFTRAIELNSSSSPTYAWYGGYLEVAGRPEEALNMMRRAEELDPLAIEPKLWSATHFRVSGRIEEAVAKILEAASFHPYDFLSPMYLGFLCLQQGKGVEGIDNMSKAVSLTRGPENQAQGGFLPHASVPLAALGYAYGITGRNEEASRVLERFLAVDFSKDQPYFEIALVYLGLGQKDRALDYLEKAVQIRDPAMIVQVHVSVDPIFAPLRGDPRFSRILESIGLKT